MDDKELKGKLILSAKSIFTISSMLLTIVFGVLLTVCIWLAMQNSDLRVRAEVAKVQLATVMTAPQLFWRTFFMEKINDHYKKVSDGMEETNRILFEALGMSESQIMIDLQKQGLLDEEGKIIDKKNTP